MHADCITSPRVAAPGAGERRSDPDSSEELDGSESQASQRGVDVLVVDDTPENLLAIEVALGDFQGRLVKVSSGAEALRELLHRNFALILLDVAMPGMDGIETARMIRARQRNRHTPIIFVTAHHGDDQAVIEAYRLGAVDFLFKPIRAEILQAKAAVFVELQRRNEELARQTVLLQEHQAREHARELAEQRRLLEEQALRDRLAQQRRASDTLERKANELARTVIQLEEARSELVRVNAKLADDDRRKDEFIATLAHELRNPLAPIVTGLELLDERTSGDETLVRVCGAMKRQTRHLIRLVDDLLDMSRVTSGKIELRKVAVDVRDVVRQALTISSPLLQDRNHEVVVDLPDEPLVVLGDDVRLAQAVSNLLNNAARYTDASGRVTVHCRGESGRALVEVTDDGQGMTPELIDRVFDLFVQGRASQGGLGIGLTLVRKLVEAHRGQVSAHSDGPGRGSRFSLALPRLTSAAPAGTSDSAPPEPPDAMLAPLDIVLIDDNDDIRTTIELMLERAGHRVRAARTGAEGIDMALRHRPDAVVVDIGLTDMLGYDVARKLRTEQGAQTPRLIAMTGFNRDQDRTRAYEAGFDCHLAKPVDGASLRRALAAVDG